MKLLSKTGFGSRIGKLSMVSPGHEVGDIDLPLLNEDEDLGENGVDPYIPCKKLAYDSCGSSIMAGCLLLIE